LGIKKLYFEQGWKFDSPKEPTALLKDFNFPSFSTVIAFINEVALKAEEQNHHPDFVGSYAKVQVKLSTHECDGISEQDIILAKSIMDCYSKVMEGV